MKRCLICQQPTGSKTADYCKFHRRLFNQPVVLPRAPIMGFKREVRK